MGYFLIHGGSGDHSSEDRVRGICSLLPEQAEIFSPVPEEDWRYGLAELGALTRIRPGSLRRVIRSGDWCVMAKPGAGRSVKRGVRRVLWGWEPSRPISRHQASLLGRYRRIVVTDERSRSLLRQAGLEKNVILGPDPAFLVERSPRKAERLLVSETVGICLSAAVAGLETRPGVLYENYCQLIRWILRNTPWQIALIPYCVRKGRDDHSLHLALMREFEGEDRLFGREDGSSCVLRYDLSLCRCCVGTAGVTAAWSCGVPGLCIGDSARARGLSATLFGSGKTGVVRVDRLGQEGNLTERFRQFLRQEDAMRRRLEIAVPRYRQWAREWSWNC